MTNQQTKVEIRKTEKGFYYFSIFESSGKVCRSKTYKTKEACIMGVAELKELLNSGDLPILESNIHENLI